MTEMEKVALEAVELLTALIKADAADAGRVAATLLQRLTATAARWRWTQPAAEKCAVSMGLWRAVPQACSAARRIAAGGGMCGHPTFESPVSNASGTQRMLKARDAAARA